MDEDEQCELVALAWIGRGDLTAEEWASAVSQARERRKGPTSEYLLGIPLLASFLEGGLAEFGESCESYEFETSIASLALRRGRTASETCLPA